MNSLAKAALLGLGLIGALTSCSGGGSSDGSPSPGTPSGTTRWLVNANVSGDSCGDRISNVNQFFDVTDNGATVTVDTSLVTLQGANGDGGFAVGFDETNGDCVRSYQASFTNVTSTSADVNLTSTSTCDGLSCGSSWVGQAVPASSSVQASVAGEDEASEKINGERCVPPVPQVGFRPSLFECNGNSAVLMRDALRNNYSVVVRRDGQFNDRDPQNPTCGTNQCSPYKTQKRIELPDYQVNCLGDSGFSETYLGVKRISVKFSARVTNSADESQFQQYCLNSKTTSLN